MTAHENAMRNFKFMKSKFSDLNNFADVAEVTESDIDFYEERKERANI